MLAALLAVSTPVQGQLPPDEAWRTLETDHFRVTYPQGLLELAQRAGDRGERAWELLSREFVEPPEGKVDLVVSDHADISNGYAQVFPSNRIVIYAPPPVDGFGLAHMDEWLELVITHELVHIFHEDYTRGLGTGLRTIFGRFPAEWPFFPGAATPSWTVEGIATYYESALTHAGRVRGSFHEMVIRTAVLEDRFESIDRASGDSPVWPGPQRYYVYGSLFFQRLMDRYGQEAMREFVDAVAGQWIPYRLNAAAEDAFGISFSQAWEEWRQELEVRYQALRDSLASRGPLTRGEPLSRGGYYALNPAPSPGGRVVAYARQDGRSDTQIRLRRLDAPDRGPSWKLARTNSLANLSWRGRGEVIFSQLAYVDSYRKRGDLYLARLQADGEGEVRRITRGQRLDHPHPHPEDPDGDRIVAVQERGGTNRLVLVSLDSGSVTPLTEYRPDVHWAYPRWSPDGRWIAVGRWQTGAYYDVVLLDARGEVVAEVTRDRAVDQAPAWSPDGRWLLWASDRSGIPNLYAVEVGEDGAGPDGNGDQLRLGPVRQVTNVLGGAGYPSAGPEGEWIYFSAYHADGWRVERVPFRPREWLDPAPVARRFLNGPDTARYHRKVQAEPEPYRSVRTLLPTYWGPTFLPGDDVQGREVLSPGFGLSTSGHDVVGRHSWVASATFASGPATFSGGFGYTFHGLGNPILGASASQSYDAHPRPLEAPDDSGDLLYLVERERQVGLGATLLRRRARNVATLGLAGSHVWEHRMLLEENLGESDRFVLRPADARLVEGRVSAAFSNARLYPFSISPEDGVGLFLRGRLRRELSVADSLRGVAGGDRSYGDVVAQLRGYKGLRWPGFGNHVLGLRVSGGWARGAGADAYHFEVGGASGAGVPLEVGALGESLFFPVRGYGTAQRFGRYAWSATAEYRFPLLMVARGPGLLPLHLDWISGSLFLDAGNAWGPDLEARGSAYRNPARDALVGGGGELTARVLPLWFASMDLRLGVAAPLVEGDGLRVYLRLGSSF